MTGYGRAVADQQPADSPYHRTLPPAGTVISGQPLVDDRLSCFEAVTLRPLAPMLVPEEPRSGVLDPSECWHCPERGRDRWIWRDEHWHVVGAFDTGLPWLGGLAPNAHLRLDELGPGELTTLGPMIQRLAGAVQELEGVARTHFARWGDGSAHFHLWFLARPLGMMQLRGAMIAAWDDMLPPIPEEEMRANVRTVAAALAAGGGAAMGDGLP